MQVLPRLFKLLPWVDLDTFYAKVKFGDIGFCMGKSENYLFFFWKLLQPWVSQSCLKHLTQWVNEVEWVSVVKVILWPWSKVTQISKLNVWLLACILRWAIQGLLALLFILRWMDGWLVILRPFLTGFQLYQNDGPVVMKGCMHRNSVYDWKDLRPRRGLAPRPPDQQVILRRNTNFAYAYSVDPDQTPHVAASD